MSWLDFVKALKTSGPVPTFSSPIYYISLIIVVGLSVGLVFLNRKMNKVAVKWTLFGMWCVMMGMEFFKQIIFSYAFSKTGLVVYYDLCGIPAHICSYALYFLPVLVFAKDGKVKQCFELYYPICFLIGGMLGMMFPAYAKEVYINYQTEIYHGLLILSSILVMLNCRDRFKVSILWKSSFLFIGGLLIAAFLIWIFTFYKVTNYTRINCFFISWYIAPGGVPVLEQLWNAAPYGVYLMVYLLFIASAGFVLYMLLSLILNRKIDFIEMAKAKKKAKVNKK